MTPCIRSSLPQPSLRSETVGFCTLPALMHEVQTLIRFGLPLMRARMRWMFGFQRRLVRRWLWLTDMPHEGCLPHTSHTAAMARNLLDVELGRETLPASVLEHPGHLVAPACEMHGISACRFELAEDAERAG